MNRSILFVLASASCFLAAAPAFAGEFGVRNTYDHSSRTGKGVQHVKQTINSQLIENGHTAAVKVVKSYKDGPGYQDHSFSATMIKGDTHFSQNTHVEVKSTENFRTNSGSFGHSTGSYFN